MSDKKGKPLGVNASALAQKRVMDDEYKKEWHLAEKYRGTPKGDMHRRNALRYYEKGTKKRKEIWWDEAGEDEFTRKKREILEESR